MKAELKMHAHIVCPHCGDAEGFRCDQILSGEWAAGFGPWACMACGHSITGKRAEDGSIDIETHGETSVKTLNVLVLKPQKKPVYFVVESSRGVFPEGHLLHDQAGDVADHARFYFEEHSCPTNWLNPETIYFDGDDDPHGLLKFVACRDESAFPADQSFGPNDRDRAIRAFIEEYADTGSPSGPQESLE